MRTKYLSLVNLLGDRELVPEFMPYFSSIEPIVENIKQLLDDSEKLAQISSELIQLAEPLAEKKTCEQVAEMAVKMLR